MPNAMTAPHLDPATKPKAEGQHNENATPETGVIEYRAVSGLAVLALFLGIISAAAMVGPILWSIPLIGVFVAMIAMRRIRSSDDLAGWNIAFLGLLLALLFGIAAPARTISRQYWLTTRADEFCDRFFELLQQHKPYVAHQLRERPGVRKPLTEALPAAYEQDPESKKNFDKFVAEEPAKTLLDLGEKANVERAATEFIGRDDRSDHYAVTYRITFDDHRSPMDVVTAVKRSLDTTTGRESWQIENISVNGVSPHSSPHEGHDH